MLSSWWWKACAFLLMLIKTVDAHYVFVKIKYSRAPLLPWDDLAWHGLCAHSWTLSLCRTGSLHPDTQFQLVLSTSFVLCHAWKISWPNPKNPQVLTIHSIKGHRPPLRCTSCSVSFSSTAIAMKVEYSLGLVFSRDLIWQNQTFDIIIDLKWIQN